MDLSKPEVQEYFTSRLNNLARCYEIDYRTDTIQNVADLETAIRNIEPKNETIRVYKNEGRYIITHQKIVDELILYFIPIGPTYQMPKKLGELTRRFLQELGAAFGLEPIIDKGSAEYTKNVIEDDPDAEKEHLDCIKEYFEGKVNNALREITAPLPTEQTDWNKILTKFRIRNDQEKKMIQTIRDGLEFLSCDNDIRSHGCYRNDFIREEDHEEIFGDTYIIEATEQMCFTWDREDEFTETMIQNMDCDIQSGACAEPFVTIEEIRPEGDTVLDDTFARGVDYIGKLIDQLETWN